MKFLDVNQHLSELDEHIKVLKSYGDVFEEVEARITRVINMDGAFKGEGAQGVIYNHAHMQLPTIRSIRAFLISFSETLEKMKAKINEYEPASNGSVSEDFWKKQLPKAYDRYEETLEEREAAINQATAEVSHILHLGKLQTGDVYNSVDSARKHTDDVLEGLYDLDQAGVELMAQVRTKMEELKATIRQVLDWTVTGGVRMTGVSIMEVGGYFANNATLHEKAPEVDTSKVSAGMHDPALAGNSTYMISYQACSFNDWANPELREDYELIYESENTSSASIGQEAGSAVLDFIPVVGNIKAGVEAVIGKDLITGRELEDWERALAGAAIMGGPIVKGASRGAKLVNNVNKANDVATSVRPYDVVPYRPSNSPLENHHGVMDIWAKHNVPGYQSRGANTPTIALTKEQHDVTKKVYREWLFERTGKRVGGRVNWNEVSPREIQQLTEQMFDAAKVPSLARQDYYRAFNQYNYRGN